eukprot:TRINITY_DN1203_c0_g1_i9.p1 TRINITY_DN1203_c0_g1~~TRINITY_DN1203_c0_g1_i9.p1  ORF type:complete len:109 (-),score=26.58 TRINITY_DN1203_c0_g1_i9:57-350(-)
MIRRPPRSTRKESSAASDVYKRQNYMKLLISEWSLLLKFISRGSFLMKGRSYKPRPQLILRVVELRRYHLLLHGLRVHVYVVAVSYTHLTLPTTPYV